MSQPVHSPTLEYNRQDAIRSWLYPGYTANNYLSWLYCNARLELFEIANHIAEIRLSNDMDPIYNTISKYVEADPVLAFIIIHLIPVIRSGT